MNKEPTLYERELLKLLESGEIVTFEALDAVPLVKVKAKDPHNRMVVHMSNLRKKGFIIQTARGVGFRLVK